MAALLVTQLALDSDPHIESKDYVSQEPAGMQQAKLHFLTYNNNATIAFQLVIS